MLQRLAFEEFHGNEVLAIFFADVMYCADVRMKWAHDPRTLERFEREAKAASALNQMKEISEPPRGLVLCPWPYTRLPFHHYQSVPGCNNVISGD